MPCGKTRVQRKVEELVASTLEAKAAAPCKALKRRVCQRARKKLAHMLPQEEFEKVVGRLKGDDAELEMVESSETLPPPQHRVETASVQPLCMQVPIIAVPVLVPMMAPQVMADTSIARSLQASPPIQTSYTSVDDDATPRTQCGNFDFQVCVADETPKCHGGHMEGPTSFYNFLDCDMKVEKQVTASTEWTEDAAVQELWHPWESAESESDGPSVMYSDFQRQVTMPVERTFIHFNTHEISMGARRRSKSQ